MPSAKTEITEIVTGMAITGAPTLAEALAGRVVANVDDAAWERLEQLEQAAQHRQEFHAAWANGQAFLQAADGLRGRPPRLVEWKGPTHAPGDEVVPADLRVDHVWLVSCKYLSKVLANAAPSRLFDRGLAGGPTQTAGDWYAEVAPDAYQALFAIARLELGTRASLPPHAADLTPAHRTELRAYLDAGWSGEARAAYRALAVEVGKASAERWRQTVAKRTDAEAVLWRLLRIGSAPYFVLGAQRDRTLRLRVMTPWDWRQAHELKRFDVWGDDAGQPQVRWQARVRDRASGEEQTVDGHVEVRWSHGRFGKPPEAKAYLDTPHHRVPGYVPLAQTSGTEAHAGASSGLMERHASADTATMVRVTTPPRRAVTTEFSEAVALHQTQLARFAYRLCGDASRAEDAVAEAYARVWPRWRRGQVGELYPYLRQAVANQIYGGHRRRLLERREAERRRPEVATPAFERQVDDHAQLWAALARLSPPHRAVVVLRLVEDLSEEEAATMLGIAPGTVKSRLSRALDHLRRLVEVEDV